MFELALPWALLALALPFIFWFLLPRTSAKLPAALRVPFFRAMVGVVDTENRRFVQYRRLGLLYLIWALLVFAAAGPRYVGEAKPLAREGYNIMMVLDISGSMELTDMLYHGRPVSRLAVVKRAAMDFVNERMGDKIGLILFGSQAYLQTPLTSDRQNVLMRLDDATVGLAGKSTSIGDALGLAVKRLQAVPNKGRVIILLTDGVNNSGVLSPIKAAELAKSDGIKVYTIGLGAELDPDEMSSMFLSMNGVAELDEETLQKIAKLTGGRYFRATDSESLKRIYGLISQLEKVSQEQAVVRPQHEYYSWPAALALLLFFYWLADMTGIFRRFRLPYRQEAMN